MAVRFISRKTVPSKLQIVAFLKTNPQKVGAESIWSPILESIELTNVDFNSNKAKGGNGGALYFNTGTITIDGGSYIANVAENSANLNKGGGAIFIDGDDKSTSQKIHLTILNATFDENKPLAPAIPKVACGVVPFIVAKAGISAPIR